MNRSRLKRWLCRTFGHRIVQTEVTAWGDTHRTIVVTCRRCKRRLTTLCPPCQAFSCEIDPRGKKLAMTRPIFALFVLTLGLMLWLFAVVFVLLKA